MKFGQFVGVVSLTWLMEFVGWFNVSEEQESIQEGRRLYMQSSHVFQSQVDYCCTTTRSI
jgi:hypothetical protein